MEVNTVFDLAGRAIVEQNGNAQRAALWEPSNFTQLTKDFCKGDNPMKDVYDTKFLRVRKHFRIALQSSITFF